MEISDVGRIKNQWNVTNGKQLFCKQLFCMFFTDF